MATDNYYLTSIQSRRTYNKQIGDFITVFRAVYSDKSRLIISARDAVALSKRYSVAITESR